MAPKLQKKTIMPSISNVWVGIDCRTFEQVKRHPTPQ